MNLRAIVRLSAVVLVSLSLAACDEGSGGGGATAPATHPAASHGSTDAAAPHPAATPTAGTPVGNAAPQQAGDPHTIKIVSSLPRTGSANKQTSDMCNGIRMALAEAGDQVGDFHLVYEDWDDASAATGNWDGQIEAANANRAASDPDVMVYIGTYNSGAAMISMPILNRAQLLMISPANTYPALTKPGTGNPNEPECYRPTGEPNYTRVVPADDIQGVVGAEWAQRLGAHRVYILHDRELYGQGIATLFQAHAEEIGLEVLGFEGIDTSATNFIAIANRIRAETPDLIFFGGTTQTKGGQLAKDLRGVGITCPLIVPDGCFEQAFIDSAGAENVNGNTYATFGGTPPDRWEGAAAEFLARYRERYHVDENPEAYAIYGYEAARVAVAAIQGAGRKDRDAIRDACFAIRDFDGCLGRWSFDANGDTSLTMMSGNVVRDGAWQFVEMLQAQQRP